MNYYANSRRYSEMTYRPCGHSGLRLPALSLGLWHNFGDTTPIERQREILRTASTSASPISTSRIITGHRRGAPKANSDACCGKTSKRTETS